MDESGSDGLARRIARIEDEQAVRDVLARYCLAADAGDDVAARALFSDDAAVDIDAAVFMTGADEVAASFRSDAHRGMLPNAAHVMGPMLVAIDGDRAVATGYMTLYMKQEAIALVRLSLGRWEFARAGGTWRIVRRIARSVGRDDTRVLLESAGRVA
jgi:hypothetical protein